MNLLGAKLYDPAVAVTKATTAGAAMTALDTTNLRLAITVPAHGMVRFRLAGCVHGATTFPSILLGVMNGATVVGRLAPIQTLGNTAVATALLNVEAVFTVTGLTPGALNADAAWAVETGIASTGIKYGGPNDTTANNAFGGFAFEAWDPQPQTANTTLAVDANGRVDISKVSGTTQTARDMGAQLDAAVSTRMATYTQPTGFLTATFPTTVASTTNITAGTITTVTNLTNAPTAGDFTAAMKTSLNAATPASVTGAVGSVTGNVGGNVSGSVGSVVGNVGGNVVGSVASVTAAVTLPTIPNNWITAAGINASALNGKGDWLLSSGYTAPDNTSITAIKSKTDSLTFTVANKLDVNTLYINGIQVNGSGTAGSPWGP